MKNLILTCSMLLCFAFASAQDTPQKTKQSKTKSDTVYSKKSKTTTQKSTSTTRKTDTVNSNHKHKKGTTKSGSTETVPQRKDSVGGTTRP
ncbi:hypothetical protein [Flavobacterium olei]|uniref:hypothetical protein n=1 Tax=Flavobacterium olei TaxID=1886782 RepID=UPI00321AEE2A